MSNQKGLSLVELLAAITILFIVSSIIYGVYFTFNGNYDRISKKNTMDQTANIVLATIKEYHQKNEQYKLKYDDTNKVAYIGQSTADQLLGNSDLKMDLKAGPLAAEPFTDLTVVTNQPLLLYLRLTDQNGQNYEIETIVKRY
jgi:prepilin-type N-terminal cleavage/methylation domain-containing protein